MAARVRRRGRGRRRRRRGAGVAPASLGDGSSRGSGGAGGSRASGRRRHPAHLRIGRDARPESRRGRHSPAPWPDRISGPSVAGTLALSIVLARKLRRRRLSETRTKALVPVGGRLGFDHLPVGGVRNRGRAWAVGDERPVLALSLRLEERLVGAMEEGLVILAGRSSAIPPENDIAAPANESRSRAPAWRRSKRLKASTVAHSGRMTANSSPPIRQGMSARRMSPVNRAPSSARTASPTRCPNDR